MEQDIENKRAEAQLRLAANVFDYALEAIIVTDVAGTILAVNRSFTEVTGYARKEVIGQNPRILKSGRQGKDFYHVMWNALQSEGRWAGELWNRRKDGREYPEHLSISAVRDTDGNVINYVGMFFDLTQRMAAEEAIRTSERKYRGMFGGAPEGVWVIGPDGGTTEVNRRVCEMLGYAPEEMHGRSPLDFADEVNREIMREARKVAKTNAHQSYEVALRHKTGHNVFVQLNATNLHNEDGSLAGVLAFLSDLTERRRMEKALNRLNEELEQRVAERTIALEVANRELEAFSYSVSHDLRAPLRAIHGFCHILQESHADKIDEQAKDLVTRVTAAAGRMGQMIDDLLNLSRISQQEMQRRAVDLSALAREVAEELQEGDPGHKAEWVIAPRVMAQGDRGLLRVVLQNLIGNAWKYSSKRDAVRIEFGIAKKEGRPVYFVRDNGAGFDMAYAGKLFGAFRRLHSPFEFPGTGIGLATVARIVHRHGGEVWADGKVNEGACFYFSLGATPGGTETPVPVSTQFQARQGPVAVRRDFRTLGEGSNLAPQSRYSHIIAGDHQVSSNGLMFQPFSADKPDVER